MSAATPGHEILNGFGTPLVTGIIALTISWALTPIVRKFAIEKGAVDDPTRDERRIHREPLPRWGGLAIYAAIAGALLLVLPFAYRGSEVFPPYLIWMIVLGGGLAVFGALDDIKDFPARWQALALLGAGVLVQVVGSHIGRVQILSLGLPLASNGSVMLLPLAVSVSLTAIYIFVVTKTMDTIDGVDGLASGIAAISSSTLVIIAVYSGQPRVAIVAAAIVGSALGFLRHNYNPAKIIMGTGGAYVLGFFLACISVVGALKTAATISLLIPVMVFGIPIFDAFFVITRRLLSGVPISQGDKRHIHHTLLKFGLSQRQTVWVLYTAAAALCVALLFVVRHIRS